MHSQNAKRWLATDESGVPRGVMIGTTTTVTTTLLASTVSGFSLAWFLMIAVGLLGLAVASVSMHYADELDE